MTAKIVKAQVTVGERIITFEGPEEFVKSMVAKYASPDAADTTKHQDKQASRAEYSETPIAADFKTERDLIAAKRPRGHHEVVAVLAFALTEAGTVEFTEGDIRRAYIRAGVRPPKVIAQALRDAKNKFDFVELAGARGLYRLTNHGDRVVRFDLPRRGRET